MVLIAFLRNDKKWNRIKNFLITLHNHITGKNSILELSYQEMKTCYVRLKTKIFEFKMHFKNIPMVNP